MKHLTLIFVISVMSTAAQAAGDRSSLFSCGVNFGGKQITYTPGNGTKSKTDYRGKHSNYSRLHHVAGAAPSRTVVLNLPQAATANKTEIRLPRKLTFAIIGCSWR